MSGTRRWASKLAIVSAVLVAALGPVSPRASFGKQALQPADGKTAPGLLQAAKAAVAQATGPTTKWFGPTTGPKGQSNKSIVCVMYLGTDPVAQEWCDGTVAAAHALGWKVTVIDGKGAPDGWRSALDQAIALKPNGIVTSIDAQAEKEPIATAASLGIVVVGEHVTATAGPDPALHIFANLTYDAAQEATIMADYAIADSNGTAHAISITDRTYAIARLKADSFASRVMQCGGCTVLLNDNIAVGTAPTRMGQEFTSYLTRWSSQIYAYAVSDFFFDTAVAALNAANLPDQGRLALLGSDGSPSAYQRIKAGKWELGTVPEPAKQQGWQAVDELNRAFAGQRWSGFTQPIHIITKDNIATDLVNMQYFDPHGNYAAHYTQLWKTGHI